MDRIQDLQPGLDLRLELGSLTRVASTGLFFQEGWAWIYGAAVCRCFRFLGQGSWIGVGYRRAWISPSSWIGVGYRQAWISPSSWIGAGYRQAWIEFRRWLRFFCLQVGWVLLASCLHYRRGQYGQELASASQALQLGTAVSLGAFEVLFHAGLMAMMQGVDP